MDEILVQNQATLHELAETIEWSVGEFHLLIARCNYRQLRSRLLSALQDQCNANLQTVSLVPDNTNLLSQIQEAIADSVFGTKSSPDAIILTGFDHVTQVDQLFAIADQAREEFRKTLPYPLVFWFDNQRFQSFHQHAPNLVTWAPVDAPIFELPGADIITSLHQGVESLYQVALDPQHMKLPTSLAAVNPLGDIYQDELPYALNALRQQQLTLSPDLNADVHFLRGLNATSTEKAQQNPDGQAVVHFQHSIDYWKAEGRRQKAEPTPSPSQEGDRSLQNPKSKIQNRLKLAINLFFLGRYWFWAIDALRRQDSANYNPDDWAKARSPLEESIQIFEQCDRSDMIAKVIRRYQGTLRRLEEWDALAHWSNRAIALHKVHGLPDRLAMAYGFGAESALQQERYDDTIQFAQQALETLYDLPTHQRWAEGLYLSLLGKAKRQVEDVDGAIAHLEQARDLGDGGNPTIYSTILEELRQLYILKKRYLEAFKLKQQRLEVEKIAGIRAFVGAGRLGAVAAQIEDGQVAPEIYASGRQRDLQTLLERIGRSDHRLTVIHGDSGVGKSSLVNAGLVPSLERKSIGTRSNGVVLMRKYGTWIETLADRVAAVFGGPRSRGSSANSQTQTNSLPLEPRALSTIAQTLQQCDDRNLRPVLIFDQFEEFFFANPHPLDRHRFFEFLSEILVIPFVNVVLSLREDYIHFLLEANRVEGMAIINHDILSKNVLYPLGNFSPQEATAIIEDLTQRSRSYFEPDLVKALVQDLAGELQQVRPIELQIVGAQLEVEKVTTIQEYKSVGEKAVHSLVALFLENVIIDCGTENREIAWKLLRLLIGERNRSLLISKDNLLSQLGIRASELNLILYVLIGSRIIREKDENSISYYQISYEYLISLIKKHERSNYFSSNILTQKDSIEVEVVNIFSGERECAKAFINSSYNYSLVPHKILKKINSQSTGQSRQLPFSTEMLDEHEIEIRPTELDKGYRFKAFSCKDKSVVVLGKDFIRIIS